MKGILQRGICLWMFLTLLLCSCTKEKEYVAPMYTSEITHRVPPTVEKAERTNPTAGKFTVSRFFDDGMILQRDEYIRIWGIAPASEDGNTVAAEFKGLYGSAVIKDGEWCILLDGTLEADNKPGSSLKVYGISKEVIFDDVLVGDVYMVIGQSNAAYDINQYVADGGSDREYFVDPDINNEENIRLFNIFTWDITGTNVTENELKQLVVSRGWLEPEKGAGNTSALGYLFAKQIVKLTNNEIPIGIISEGFPACCLAAFMPASVAEEAKIDRYVENQGGYVAYSAVGQQLSRVLYNQFIAPIRNASLTGLIWYQGESDCVSYSRVKYAERFTATMKAYRDAFDQNYHDFPIFIIELPSIYPMPTGFAEQWHYMDFGVVRSVMGSIPSMLDNSYVAVSSDIWKNTSFYNSLHPYCKWQNAQRVTDIVQKLIYGIGDDIDYTTGPSYHSYEASEDGRSVDIFFTHVGKELSTHNDKAVMGVEICVDGIWRSADKAYISNSYTLTVTSKDEIQGIRYFNQASDSFPEKINMCNSKGVPAAGFYINISILGDE